MIRISIVDDHALFLESVSEKLAKEPDFSILSTHTTILDALEFFNAQNPDILLTDLCFRHKNQGGLELIAECKKRYPEMKILAMTGYDDRLFFQKALELKANACFCKENNSQELKKAIRMIAKNEQYLSAEVEDFLKEHSPMFLSPLNNLTSKEKEVLALISLTDAEIMKKLGIKKTMTQRYIQNLKIKTSCETRSKLAEFAVRNGFILP